MLRGLKRTYGCIGDGVADDTERIQTALTDGEVVEIEAGTYRITEPLSIVSGCFIVGHGSASIIAPDSGVNGIIIKGRKNVLRDFSILGGDKAVILRGESAVCTFNRLSNLILESNNTGLYLDGYTDTAKPCYWNTFQSVLVWKPKRHGVWLTKTGAGDTPNANRFYDLNVYSNSNAPDAADTYSGVWVEHGRFHNTFVDSHVALHADFASCVKVGAAAGGSATATDTVLMNLYTETNSTVPNVRLEADSEDTVIINLLPMSAGANISDASSGNYRGFNVGGSSDNDKAGVLLAEEIKTGRLSLTFAAAVPPQSTYRDQAYASAIPTTGSYVRGDFVWNSAPAAAGTLGWSRLTTGSGHVDGTDWKAIAVPS